MWFVVTTGPQSRVATTTVSILYIAVLDASVGSLVIGLGPTIRTLIHSFRRETVPETRRVVIGTE